MSLELNTKQYLENLLNSQNIYDYSPKEVKQIKAAPLDYIVNKLTRKKFRRRKLVDKTREEITKKIQISIDENKPIHFVIPFGGYKHFWNHSYPEPDWAEVFNMVYITEFVLPVLGVHKPGVIVEYVSEDLMMARMDNFPQEDLNKYSIAFKKLIEKYNKHTPDNLEFKFFRVGDKCDVGGIISQVEKLLPERRAEFEKLSNEEKDKELHRSKRSFLWDGEQDFTGLSQKEKDEKIIESRLIELAYYDTEEKPEFLGEYLWEDNHICLLSSFGTTHDNDDFEDLTIGSAHGSIVDFWVGRGILVQQDDKIFPKIVSKTQYENMKEKLIPVDTDGLINMQNYEKIEVLK